MEYHNTYTYIIESQKFYKIGKTKNISRRLVTFDTQNPIFKLIRLYDSDFEIILHRIFADKRFKLEWFKLSKKDLQFIDDLARNSNIKNLSTDIIYRVSGMFGKEADEVRKKRNNRERKVKRVAENGDLLGRWSSIKEASVDTGYNVSTLHNATRLNRKYANSYWVYDVDI